MDHSAVNVLSLCAGIGGIDLGIRIAVPVARTICFVERELAACRILATRMEEGSLDPAPVWLDLSTFDGRPWRGLVDLVIAGLPCQPYSVAGKQRGSSDERSWGDGDGPVPIALRIIAECQPSLVFFENVPPWITGGHFRSVGEELSRLGYEVEEALFIRAEDVGASHRRERVFILAHCMGYSDRGGQQGGWLPVQRTHEGAGRNQPDADRPGVRGVELANAGRGSVSGRARLHARGVGSKASEVESRSEDPQRQRLRGTSGDGGEPVRSGIPGVGLADTYGKRCKIRSGQRCNDESQCPTAERDCGGIPGVNQVDTSCCRQRGKSDACVEPGGVAGSGEPVGNATNGQPCGLSSRAGEFLSRSGITSGEQAVGNAECPEWRQAEEGWSHVARRSNCERREEASGLELPDPAVGNATSDGRGEGRTQSEFWRRWHASGCDGSVSPPGPGEHHRWNAILERFPELAPAIDQETLESVLRDVASGDAASLDYSRIDSLQGLGNLCVPLQAAVAFTILARKAGVMPC